MKCSEFVLVNSHQNQYFIYSHEQIILINEIIPLVKYAKKKTKIIMTPKAGKPTDKLILHRAPGVKKVFKYKIHHTNENSRLPKPS